MPTCREAPQCARATAPHRRTRVLAWLLATALVAIGAPSAALADDDLPGRVGRIAEFAGQLYLAPEERASEWQPIGLNYPVASGDNVWVGGGGRAEVDYGGGQFRLAGDTNLHVSRLDENQLALFVAQGRLIVRVRFLDAGDSARIDAPNAQIQLTRPGLYRIDVAPERQSTAVSVREGEAIVALAGGSQQTLPGQTAIVTGPDPAYADVRNGVGLDDFDAYSASRDRRYERPRATAYVSPQMVGYADLDALWQLGVDAGLRARLVSKRGRARLGAVSRRLLDQCRRVGLHLGGCRAMGLRALPLRSLGVGPWSLGLVPGNVCRAAALGARAGGLGRRRALGTVRQRRRSGLRLGAAGMGRAVPSVVGTLLVQLLGDVQPPVRGQRRDAAGESAVAFPQFRFSRCGDRCFRRHAAKAAACRVQSRDGADASDGQCASARRRPRGRRCTTARSGNARRHRRDAATRVDVLSDDAIGTANAAAAVASGRSRSARLRGSAKHGASGRRCDAGARRFPGAVHAASAGCAAARCQRAGHDQRSRAN